MRAWQVFVVLLSVWLCTQAAEAQLSGPFRSSLAAPQREQRSRDAGAFARGAGIFGTITAGLLLGGSIAIAVVDDLPSERVTRGVWLGTLGLSAPLVALGGWTARKRAKVEGYKAVRLLGWTSYAFAVGNGILQWYEAFHDEGQPWGLTVGLGVLGVMSMLPLSLDAYVSGRRAGMRRRIAAVRVAPLGLALQF